MNGFVRAPPTTVDATSSHPSEKVSRTQHKNASLLVLLKTFGIGRKSLEHRGWRIRQSPLYWRFQRLRNIGLRTPPGPEGSNGSLSGIAAVLWSLFQFSVSNRKIHGFSPSDSVCVSIWRLGESLFVAALGPDEKAPPRAAFCWSVGAPRYRAMKGSPANLPRALSP